jgi:ketosteroid isomerase-like protein
VDPTVEAFIACINRQDIDGLCRLMTADHLFVDSLGDEIRGREAMRAGWRAYFGMVPDYRITITDCVERGPVTAIFGRAGGTYSPDGRMLPHNRWETPAAWKAVVRDGLVAEWRVFADNEPIRRLMRTAPV